MSGTQVETGGRLTQSAEANVAGGYVGVYSTNLYDLTGKSVQIEIAQLPAVTPGSQAYMREEIDAYNGVAIGFSDNTIYAQSQVANVWATLAQFAWPMSPPVRALKLSFEATGWTFWEYSQDGVNFLTLASLPTPFGITALRTVIGTGTWQANAAPGTTQWDNFNIPLILLTLSGTAAGKATIGVTSVTRRRPVSGTSPGVATVSVQLTDRRALVGTSPGLSTAAGAASARRSLVASAAGVAVTTGRFTLSGQSKGTSTASAQTTRLRPLTGTSPGASTAAGATTRRRSLTVASAGSAATNQALTARRLLTGAGAGVAVTTARFTLAGQTVGRATAAGAVSARRSLVVTAPGTSTVVASASRRRPLSATSSGTSTVAVAIGRRRSLSASSPGVSTVAGAVTDKRLIVGVQPALGATSLLGATTAYRRLLGASVASASAVGLLTRVRRFQSVSAAGVATVNGQPGVNKLLTATAAGRTTVAVLVSRYRLIAPVRSDGKTLLVVIIGRKRTILGTTLIPGVAVTAGTTTARRSLSGSPQGSASVSGTIAKYLGMQHVLWEYHGAQFVFPPSPGLHEVIWLPDEHFTLDPNPSEITVPYQAEVEAEV